MQWHFHVAYACWHTSHVLAHTHSHLFMLHDLAFMSVCVRAVTFKSGFSPTPPAAYPLCKKCFFFFSYPLLSPSVSSFTHIVVHTMDRHSVF